MGNRLLVFSVQLCFVLHAERHHSTPCREWEQYRYITTSLGHATPILPFPPQPPLVAQVVGASARDPRRGDRLARSVLVQGRVEVQDLASVTVPAVDDKVDGETHQLELICEQM